MKILLQYRITLHINLCHRLKLFHQLTFQYNCIDHQIGIQNTQWITSYNQCFLSVLSPSNAHCTPKVVAASGVYTNKRTKNVDNLWTQKQYNENEYNIHFPHRAFRNIYINKIHNYFEPLHQALQEIIVPNPIQITAIQNGCSAVIIYK